MTSHDEQSSQEENEEDPGDQIMWFGAHKNRLRFNELEESYVQKIMNMYDEDSDNNPAWLCRFYNTYHAHNEWLENRGQARSPASIIIWFGKQWKGREMRVLLQAPMRWRWFVGNTKWKNRLSQIEREWWAWKERHPRACGGGRAPRVVVDPIGEKISWRDSEPPTDEDYDDNDSFIDDGDGDDQVGSGYEDEESVDLDDDEEQEDMENEEEMGSDTVQMDDLGNGSSLQDKAEEIANQEGFHTPRRQQLQDRAFSFQQSPTTVSTARRRKPNMFEESVLDSDGEPTIKKVRVSRQLSFTKTKSPNVPSSRKRSDTEKIYSAERRRNTAIIDENGDESDLQISPSRPRRMITAITSEDSDSDLPDISREGGRGVPSKSTPSKRLSRNSSQSRTCLTKGKKEDPIEL